jgi:anaerobic selenocysteine-containing dehydrogenase
METAHMTAHTYRICPFCEACCGLEVGVDDGRVVSVRGMASDVFSGGYLCPKGVALKDLHEDPDRLRTPLIKRDGRFVEATWDEAIAEIERRLVPVIETHGRDAVGLVFGNPSVHKMGLILNFPRLARALGSRNVFSASTLDQMPKQLSSGLLFGHWLSVAVPDIDRTDYLLILGANPVVSNGSMWTVPDFRGRAKAMKARGAKLVVIDPRRTETADIADEHHFIRPGGDAFLLMGMAQVLLAEGLVSLGHLEGHVAGVEAVGAAVRDCTPEAMAPRCGIDAATIRRLAREFAAAKSGAVYGRLGTCTQRYGTLVSWLIDVLNILTGKLDRPGGAMFPKAPAFQANTTGKSGIGKGVAVGRHASRVSGAPEVFGEYPIGCLAEEIETGDKGQIRALIALAANPVLSAPNGARLSRALAGLDFMLSVDIYRNETSRHADVILPGLSPLEEMHYDVAFPQLSYRNHARVSPPVLQPPPGARPEWQTLMRLAALLQGQGAKADPVAYDDQVFAEEVRRLAGDAHAGAIIAAMGELKGPERLLELGLRAGPYGDGFGRNPAGLTLAKVLAAPGGIDLGPLTPRIPEVLRTPSGKIELAAPLVMADLEAAKADTGASLTMTIVGRRQVRSNNSWMHNLPVLAKGPFRCTAEVHPSDAARIGLTGPGRARLSTSVASVEVDVEISERVMPGVVSLPHGWGHDLDGAQLRVAAGRPGVNLNALFDETARDPLSGNAVLSGVPVTLAAA